MLVRRKLNSSGKMAWDKARNQDGSTQPYPVKLDTPDSGVPSIGVNGVYVRYCRSLCGNVRAVYCTSTT